MSRELTRHNTSITANTIPSSAINGGISVSLPSTTMAARTSTQIGYTISKSGTNTFAPYTWANFCSHNFSPAGSIWIINGSVGCTAGVAVKTFWTTFSQVASGVTTVNYQTGIANNMLALTTGTFDMGRYYLTAGGPLLHVFTVPSTTDTTLVFGAQFEATSGSLTCPFTWTATRIA